MDYTAIIIENLNAIGKDYNVLKDKKKQQLAELEALIQKKKAEQDEALAVLDGIDFSVKGIAEELDLSRTTLYSDEQLLRRYLEYSSAKVIAENPLQAKNREIERLQEEKRSLQNKVELMQIRDVDTQIAKEQTKNLANLIKGKDAEIERLNERLRAVSAENEQLKKRMPQAASIPIKKD